MKHQYRPRLTLAHVDTIIDALCIASNDARSSQMKALQLDPPDGDLAVAFHNEALRYERMLYKLAVLEQRFETDFCFEPPILIEAGTPGYFDSDCEVCGDRLPCAHRTF